jgi:glycosyltransferase involved in cell wall biosynthesis
MRIGFFSTMGGLPWGGSEELWCRTAMSLRERGHEVAFNCLKWPTVANPLQQLIDRGATPHFRSRRRMGRSLRQTLQKLRLTSYKYRPWLRSCKPDFVLISFSCHTDDPQIANSCHALGIPYAIVLQAAGPHNWIDPRYIEEFRSAYVHARKCYFVSADNREILESNLAVHLPQAEVVDNPFTVRVDAAPSWPSAAPLWKLACVARIHFITKSQDLLVRVLRQPKWRSRPLQITLWGSDNGNLNQLRRSIELHRLEKQLTYGGVSNDIDRLWSEHHGLILPSRAEGNALSLIEAMMCGRVPVTTRTGRAGELIDDNESGFLAPAATADLIDAVLERAWYRREDWQAMGERAARAIRQRHSLRPAEDFADRILAAASDTSLVRKLAA